MTSSSPLPAFPAFLFGGTKDVLHCTYMLVALPLLTLMASSFSSHHLLCITAITCILLRLLCKTLLRLSTNATADNSSKANHPPGTTGLPLLGETLSFLAANNSTRGFYHFVHTRHLRYGRCFRTSIFGQTHVFVATTDAARSLLPSDSLDFAKRYITTVADLLGDHSLLCSSHQYHRFIRRCVAGLFTLDATTSFAAIFDGLVAQLMREWARRQRVVVLDAALTITFKAICKMLMSTEDDEKLEELQSDVFDVTEAMLAFPLRIPGTRFYRGLQARKRIMHAMRQEIALRRKGSSEHHHNDFLQCLLQKGQSESEEALTDEQILDNILTLIIAGQVTTATAITWMVKYLDENREFQETLRSIQLDLATEKHDLPLTLEDLNRMEYAYKAVKESLRMATIVSWFPRVALKDCQIAGFDIQKGWIVNVDARSIHYDSMLYDNPMTFDPSRFNEDLKPYSFLAFGAGGRTCLGMNFAKIMMLIFLHRLITTFRWEVTDQDSSLEKWAMFPRLKNGCPIQLTPINEE